MLSFANPTLPEFSDDLLVAPAVGALQGPHGKPNTFSSYTTRRDTAAPYGEASEEDILLRSRLTVIIANLVEKIEMFSVGVDITEGVDLSKDFRFMVIYFKSAVTRGLAWNGTSLTSRIVDGMLVWDFDTWMGSEWPKATAENWISLKHKWNSG